MNELTTEKSRDGLDRLVEHAIAMDKIMEAEARARNMQVAEIAKERARVEEEKARSISAMTVRNCPKCLKDLVMEDGCCGHCREGTMPPVEPGVIPARVAEAIASELKHFQASKWPHFPHNPAEWILFLRKHLNDAEGAWHNYEDYYAVMYQFRQIAAVAVAAMTQCGSPCRVTDKP